MVRNYDDSNWRSEYLDLKVLSISQCELLEKGPKSLSQSWILGAMYNDWKRIKGYTDPEPPNVQSSLSEFYKIQDGYDKDPDGGIFDDHTDPYGGH